MASYLLDTAEGKYKVDFDRELSPTEEQSLRGKSVGEVQKMFGSAQPASASAPAAPTPERSGMVKSLLGEPYYKTFVRPSGDINRLGYSLLGEHAGFEEPSKYKERQVERGRYGAERLSTEVPHGWLEHLGAAASPMEAGLLETPMGRAVFGLGTVVGAGTKDDQVVDAVEGAGGLVMLGRDLVRAGKLVKRKLSWPFSMAEKAYTVAKGEVPGAEAVASKAQDAANAVELHVADARNKARIIAQEAEQAAQGRLETAEGEHKAALEHVGQLEKDLTVPTDTLRDKMQLSSGGATAESVGRMLQAVEEDATALSQDAKHPVGASAKALKLTEVSGDLQRTFEKTGEAKSVKLPAGSSKDRASASATVVRRRGVQYLKSLIEGQGTVSEKAIAREVSMLGVSALRDLETGEIIKVRDPSRFAQLMKMNPHMKPVYEDVPISKLSQLYTKAHEIGLSPREFPTSTKSAQRKYARMVGSIRTALGAVAAADPETNQAFVAWQRHVRRVEQPFLRETAARMLAPTATARRAFETLTADDPTSMERYFQHATGPERSAITHAVWNELVVDASQGEQVTDFRKLAKRYKELPQESRELISSWANGAAKAVVDEGQVRVKRLVEGKAAAGEAAKAVRAESKALRVAKSRGRVWMRDVMEPWQREVTARADTETKKTLEALAKAQSKVERLGGLRVFTPEASVKQAQEGTIAQFVPSGSYRMFAKAHVVMGIVDILHGNVVRALLQGGEAMMFRRNKLVREALETPIKSPRAKEVGLAMYMLMRPYLGPPVGPGTPDDSSTNNFRNAP